MAESNEQKIASLMALGLDHYGQDDIERAVACWQAVLELDPRHEVARDYLEVAGYGARSAGEKPAPANLAAQRLRDAQALIERGSDVEALELLEGAVRDAPGHLESQAALELLRANLYQRHRKRTRGGAGVLRVRLGPQEILRFNMPPNAGFVLSMIDGHTSADELVALASMDPFEALHTLAKLMDAGIVEVRA
ncbi:MAG TPA: tetratricopeptide repeat protein [Myxococcota bacterium]